MVEKLGTSFQSQYLNLICDPINVHILHALILQTIPFELPRKPPTANWWVLLLALSEETNIIINIVPCVKCAPETTAGGRHAPGSLDVEGTGQHDQYPLHHLTYALSINSSPPKQLDVATSTFADALVSSKAGICDGVPSTEV